MRAVAVCLLAMVGLGVAPAASAQPDLGSGRQGRVVIFSLPAVTWGDIEEGSSEHLRELMYGVAAMSARTAARAPNPERGYITLGAGNAGYVAGSDQEAHLAFEAATTFEGTTARAAAARRTGVESRGEIVHVGAGYIQELQLSRLYGAEAGSLGEALRRAGIPRAVVSAGDIAVDPEPEEQRRASVLSLMDAAGGVDHGRLDGLLEVDARAPFGVRTDIDAFMAATEQALEDARVVLLEAGETLRADEHGRLVAADVIGEQRRRALERTDEIAGRLLGLLEPEDLVIVASSSSPTAPGYLEHLVPLGIGPAQRFGGSMERWLTSPTTGRNGMATLSDVAPTVLDIVGVAAPGDFSGTAISLGEEADDALRSMIDLDRASIFREDFAVTLFYEIAVLLSVIALLAFVVFLHPDRPLLRWLIAASYLALAIFPASHIIRVFETWRLGTGPAHVVLYVVAALLALGAAAVPGPRWSGAVGLMLLSALFLGTDALFGGPFQVNGIFGHSPLVAGRFYGLSNPGHAILYPAGILGVTGLVTLRGHRRAPVWLGVVLAAMLPLVGLPIFGANFGGFLTGVGAVAVTYTLARGRRLRWGWILMGALVAVALSVGLAFLDFLRAPEARTHLGRFAADIAAGDLDAVVEVITRKGSAVLSSLRLTRWTYMVPVGAAVLTLLLVRPQGVLRDVLASKPVLRAGLWGTLVVALVGFAVNDSGISVPALALAHAVPFLVLMAIDPISPGAHAR